MYTAHFNSVSVSGTLCEDPVFSHESHGKQIYCFPLSIRRLSGKEDILRVQLRSSLLSSSAPRKGDRVTLDGEIRSFNDHAENASHLLISVFVRNLSPAAEEDRNSCTLTGAVCRQPVFRRTPLGRDICDFMLAVNRRYQKSDYIPVIAWGQNARFLSEIPVGTDITVEGRLQSRNYIKLTPDGRIEKTAYELSVSSFAESQLPEFTGDFPEQSEHTILAEEIPPNA